MQHRGRERGRGSGFRGGFSGRGGGGGRFGGGGRGFSNASSRGGGRGAYSGPKLPFALTREIGMEDDTSGGGGNRENDSQFDRRNNSRRHVADAAGADDGRRSGKKQKRRGARSPSPDNDEDRALFDEDDSDALAPSPSPPPPQSSSKRTKFEELLLNQAGGGSNNRSLLLAGTGAAAAEAEAALQRRLAKQLGLRGKAKQRALAQPEGLFGIRENTKKKTKVSLIPERKMKKRENSGDGEDDVPPLSDSDDDCFGLNAGIGEDESEDDEKEGAVCEGEQVSSSSDGDDDGSSESDDNDEESDSDAPPLSDSDDDCFGLNANFDDEDEDDGEDDKEAEESDKERDGEANLFSSSSSDADDADDDGSQSQSESASASERDSDDDGSQSQSESASASERDSDDGEEARQGGDTSAAASLPPQTRPTKGQYLPPAARAAAAAAAAATAAAAKKGESNVDAAAAADDEGAAVLRRVRGLLNRLAEANLRGVSRDIATLHSSSPPALVREALCSELVSAAAKGPRASAAFASAAAALVAAVAANARSTRLAAEFAASAALALEETLKGNGRAKKGMERNGGGGGGGGGGESSEPAADASAVDSTAASNLASLVCALHSVGVLRPAAIFSYLEKRFERFDRDADVAAAAAVLRASGARLRAEDPAALRGSVLAAAERAAEARSSGKLTARGEALLSLVLDVKNNRRSGSAMGGQQQQQPGTLSAATMRWLRSGASSSNSSSAAAASSSPTLGEEHYALHGVAWETLISPVKRGRWWLPSAAPAGEKKKEDEKLSARSSPSGARLAEDDEEDAENICGLETEDLLALVATQRMGSTPSRRACFCATMGAAAAADGAERLLRLPLRGAAARDVVRVPLSCALREASWNPYYSALLSRLARAKRAHRSSLVLALRDELRDAAAGGGGGENQNSDPRAAATLARLVGSLVANHAVPLSPLLPREGKRSFLSSSSAAAAARGDEAAAAAAAETARCGLSAGTPAIAALLPPRRIALWRALLRHALASAPDRAAAASPFERMSAAALAAKKNGSRNRSARDSDDELDDGFSEARLANMKKKEAKSSSASRPAFPPLDAGEACASLRSFIRRFVVPGVDGTTAASPGDAMFGNVSLDELTLRARGAERALAAGAKVAALWSVA